MNPTEFFSVVIVFLLCNVGIGCLEMLLEGFRFNCGYRKQCGAHAAKHYDLKGTMVLNVGEELPKTIDIEELSPPSKECATHDGKGSWTSFEGYRTTHCHDNKTDLVFGCYLLSERKYGFIAHVGFYYMTRFCKYRVRPCQKNYVACGPASNELKVSDLRTDSRYGYNASKDAVFESYEKKCREEEQRASHNGKEGKRHPSDDFLVIFGAVLAINMIVFY